MPKKIKTQSGVAGSSPKKPGKKLPAVVYGLDGICEIFNISKTTACRYHKGIIKDACTQQGKVIVVDVKKAFELFGCEKPENFI